MSSIYTYNSIVMRRESRLGPFPPSYPSHANPNSQSEGYSKPKITSPITGKCYSHDDLGHGDDEDEDDYKKHEAYPMKGGYEWHNRPKSPVPGSPGKVPNEASRPQRSSPLAATDMRHSAQPKPYGSGNNGSGDYGGSDKEGRKPIGSTNRNNRRYDAPIAYGDHDDEDEKYDGADNGYGSYGNNNNNNNKQGKLPTSPTRSGAYDDYGGANRGYGGYGDNKNKEGYKPTWNGGYDGADRGYGDNNSKEWYQPTISPIRMGKYDGANKGSDGYGNYNKEGYKSSSSPVRNVIISSPSQKEKNGGYDGANKDHGGFENYNNKEGYNPTSSPARNGNCGSMLRPDKNYGGAMDPNNPKIGTSWTSLPRKGGQLSQPTNDIQKVMELMKEAALNDEDENYSRNHDGVDRSAPRNSNWAASLGNDPQHGELRGRFDNGFLVGSPKSQSSLSKPGMVSNKNDYGESIEKKDATSWNNGKISLSQRPQTPITHVIDGREANHRTRATGPIISSNAVEKIGGTRI